MAVIKKFLPHRLTAVAILLMGAIFSVMASPRTISGIVLDEQGEPLPGATVREIPASKTNSVASVLTDINGHFTFTVPSTATAIEALFIGYKPKTIDITKTQDFKIILEPNSEMLEDVVVTGYQTISKERATGSFAKVERAQLDNQNITSVSDMLEGHVAGYTDGKIRGITSMQGVSQPLYVVDGFPVERTTVGWAGGGFQDSDPDINVDDIESITVLKDAAATSIYGARAANGVIVITTKKAKRGTTNVSGSLTFTVQPYKRVDTFSSDSRMLIDEVCDWMGQNPNFRDENAQSYAENMLKNSSGLSPHMKAIYQRYAGQITEQQLNSMLDNWSKQGYRWYDEADKIEKRNATTQRYNLSISTANDINSFVGTISYYRQNPFSRNSYNQNLDISLRNTVNLAKWLTVDLGASVIYNQSETATYTFYSPGFAITPYMSVYDDDGNVIVSRQEDRLSKSRLDAINKYGLYNEDINPIDELGRSPEKTSDLLTRLYARLLFNITDYLRFTSQFQYEFGNFQTSQRQEKETYAVRNKINNFASTNDGETAIFNLPYGDIYSNGYNDQRAYNFRNQLDFNKTFAEEHEVTAIAGFEMRHNKTRSETKSLFGYDDQMNTWTTVDQTALQSFAGAIFGRPWISAADFASINELVNRFISFYANAAYTYNDRYMINGSIRTDRTNLYGTGSKYQGKPIWSVGAGWRIDKEKFFTWEKINILKLRLSYGIGGNIAKNQWPYLTAYYGTNTHPGVGGIQGSISSRPNPTLRWEKTITTNIGVDFGMFNNRLSGSIDFYNKKGKDLLASSNGISVEGQGFSTNTINNGVMTNRGVELNIRGTAIQTRDWTWMIQGVFGYNHSNVDYVNVEAPIYFLQLDYPQSFPRVGVPFTAMYGYEWAGLSEDGLPRVYDHNGELCTQNTPTELDDIIYLGSTTPTYSGSVSTNLRWRDFTFSLLALFEGGHKQRSSLFTYDDRWKKPGDEAKTDFPRYVSAENPDFYCNMDLFDRSSAAVYDVSNLRIRNISLSYNLPRKYCSKIYAQNIRIMFGLEDVATFAKSKQMKYALGGYNHPNYMMSLNLSF